MMKWRATSLLCLAISAVLFIGSLINNGTTPQFVLVRRIKQLEAQNEKLRGDLRLLTAEVGGFTGAKDARMSETHTPYEHEEQLYDSARIRCEVIHIAIVAAGYNTSRTVVTLLKSILFYRHNPLHFHFISDHNARHTLGTLFETWRLPAVNISFYAAEIAQTNISWIPNFHYSGVYGLMKLTFTDMLPAHLDKVVVLDTDLMFTSDIAGLWQFFKLIRQGRKLFGIVENQSDWYLGKLWVGHKPWPALGRGYNTGVMLLDLHAMRQQQWYKTWYEVATKTLGDYGAAALADQDIINAVIAERPEVHSILPCAWNVQLSEHTLSEYCYRDAEEFKVIHWNSPKKLDVSNNHGPYFRNLYMTFQGYDGNLLRSELLSCSDYKSNNEDTQVAGPALADPCSDFRKDVTIVHRTHPFFDYAPMDPEHDDVTLVTQLSMDRLPLLGPLCEQWNGPMSVALYASDAESQQFLLRFHRAQSTLRSCRSIALHIVYKEGQFYPVNYLRNVALTNVQTPYVFLTDIDFLPMPDLYSYIREAIQVLGMAHGRRALVIPAFETLLYKFNFPNNKAELLKMLTANTAYTFRYHIWPKGHSPTNYEHWKTADVPYKVDWAPDFEPYVVVSNNVTRYSTQFVGFGWNKVSHIMELNAQGYEFVVLPDAFIVHMPHAPSPEIASFRGSKHYRDCMQVLKTEFQRDLRTKYNHTHGM